MKIYGNDSDYEGGSSDGKPSESGEATEDIRDEANITQTVVTDVRAKGEPNHYAGHVQIFRMSNIDKPIAKISTKNKVGEISNNPITIFLNTFEIQKDPFTTGEITVPNLQMTRGSFLKSQTLKGDQPTEKEEELNVSTN